jgi:hypothetical protein
MAGTLEKRARKSNPEIASSVSTQGFIYQALNKTETVSIGRGVLFKVTREDTKSVTEVINTLL